MNKTIATGLIASALTFGATTFTKSDGTFDTKGQDVKIQVMITEPNFKDAVYYTPEEWSEKTETSINAEKQKRFDDWDALVKEQSSKVTPEPIAEEIIDEKLP